MISVSDRIESNSEQLACNSLDGCCRNRLGNGSPFLCSDGTTGNVSEFPKKNTSLSEKKESEISPVSDSITRHVHFELGRNRYHCLPSNKQLKKRARMMASIKAKKVDDLETVSGKNYSAVSDRFKIQKYNPASDSSSSFENNNAEESSVLPMKSQPIRPGILKNTRNPNFQEEIKRLSALSIAESNRSSEMISGASSADKDAVSENKKCFDAPSDTICKDEPDIDEGSSQLVDKMDRKPSKNGSFPGKISSKYECLAHIEFPPTKKKHSLTTTPYGPKNIFAHQTGHKTKNNGQQNENFGDETAEIEKPSIKILDKTCSDARVPRIIRDDAKISKYLSFGKISNCSNECRVDQSDELSRASLKRDNLEKGKQCNKKPSRNSSHERLLLMNPCSTGMRLSFTSAC